MSDEIDFYDSYNEKRYVHYRMEPIGKFKVKTTTRNGEKYNSKQPLFEKQKISFEEIKKMDLDKYGLDVRTNEGNFIQIHNYLLDFWGAIIGNDAVSLFVHLKRYCYGDLKDFCFPDLNKIQQKMKIKSRKTMVRYIDTLEEFGFVVKILRLDVERKNANSSSFYKVRKYIPMLSEDLVLQLPKGLQADHEEFIAKTKGILLTPTFEPKQTIDELRQLTSDVIKSKQQQGVEDNLKRLGKIREYLLSKLTADQHEAWFLVLGKLKERVSKPSFETWFTKSLIIVDPGEKRIYLLSEEKFYLDHLKMNYAAMVLKIAKETFPYQIDTCEVLYFDEYIEMMERDN